MITLEELNDCKTCEQMTEMIHQDLYDKVWDDDDWWEEEGEEGGRPVLSRAEEDICSSLMREALECAAAGDLEEAKLRVRNRYHPKFHSLEECLHAYQEAMDVRGVR